MKTASWHFQRVALKSFITAILCLLAGQGAYAQSDPMGYQALLVSLSAAGLPAPGTGVEVAQVEASLQYSGTPYQFVPDVTQFSGVTITNWSSSEGTLVSYHATNVGHQFYGSSSYASGITKVDVYEANSWIDYLYPTSGPVGGGFPSTDAVANFSFNGSLYDSISGDVDIIRRFDYVITHNNLTAVVAVSDGGAIPYLMSGSYNAITVGESNGTSGSGTVASGYDGAGRCEVDIVAPESATSYAAPDVAAAAAMVVQVGKAKVYSNYNNPVVVKAILMAGASKNNVAGTGVASWVRTQTQPLDLQYGAGQLNFENSYQILTAGPQSSSASSLVASTGWSYQSLSSSASTNYFISVPAGQTYDFSAILDWASSNSLVSGVMTRAPLDNLDLQLYQTNGNFTRTTLYDQSISSVDNVQDIFQRMLPSGTYDLCVSRVDSNGGSQPFALAWQTQASTVIPVWAGGGATNNWTLAANWGGGTPTAPDALTFGTLASGASNQSNNDFAAGTQFGGLVFTSTASSYSLTGNAINLSGAITNSSTSSESIGLNLQLVTGGGTVNTGAATMTISGVISGNGQALVKQGSGLLILANSNTYSGGTTISSGTLQVGAGDNYSTLGTGNVVDNAVLAFNLSGSNSVTNLISGAGAVRMLGGGLVSLKGTNSYSGGTAITSGILEFASPLAMSATGTVTVSSGAVLAVNAGGAGQFTNATSGSGSIGGLLAGIGGQGAPVSWNSGALLGIDTTSATGGSLTYAGNIVNSGSNSLGLMKFGTGMLVLAGSNGYTGTTNILAGTLNLANTAALGSSSPIIFGGGTLQYTNSNAVDYSSRITSSTAAISIDTNGQNVTYQNPLAASNAGGLTKVGAGTLVLAAANNFSGTTLSSGGTLTLASAMALQYSTVNTSGAGLLSFGTLSSATFSGLTNTGTLNLANNSSNAVALSVGYNNASSTYLGTLAGLGSLTKIGSGVLTLAGPNNYSGSTIINAGTLQVGTGDSVSTLGSGNIVDNGLLLIDRSGSYTMPNAISGSGTIDLIGGGLISLTNTNSFTGSIEVASGTLSLAGALALQSATFNTSGSGALSFGTLSAASLGGITGSNSLALINGSSGALALTLGKNNASSSVAVQLTGPGSLIKTGTGLVDLTGNNSFTGGTTVSAGLLEFGTTSAMPSSGPLSVAGSAALVLGVGGSGQFTTATSGSGSIGGILQASSGSSGGGQGGPVTLASGAILGIDTSGSTGGVTYAGNIGNTNSGANSLALLKIGSGTLTLSGTDTYTGGTTVSNGILVFKGASSIPVGSSLVIGTGTEQYGPASLASGVDAPSNVVSGNAASAPALQGASSTLNVAPEPTTLSMMFVVFAAVGFGVWRRRQGLGISG